MSAIVSIFNGVAAQAVTVGAVTPTVYNIDTLPAAVAPAQLPCRLMLPMDAKTEATSGQFLGFGTISTVTWRITDLMLWTPVLSGAGIHDYALTLVQYAGAYMDMLRKIRAPAPITRITNWSAQPGRFQYPLRSGRWYFGVECMIEVQEILSG